MTFLIHYELLENQKKFGFSQCFGDDLEGAGTINPHPHSSHIQKPHTIRIKSFVNSIYIFMYVDLILIFSNVKFKLVNSSLIMVSADIRRVSLNFKTFRE